VLALPKLATQPAEPSASEMRSTRRRNSAGGSASPPKQRAVDSDFDEALDHVARHVGAGVELVAALTDFFEDLLEKRGAAGEGRINFGGD